MGSQEAEEADGLGLGLGRLPGWGGLREHFQPGLAARLGPDSAPDLPSREIFWVSGIPLESPPLPASRHSTFLGGGSTSLPVGPSVRGVCKLKMSFSFFLHIGERTYPLVIIIFFFFF